MSNEPTNPVPPQGEPQQPPAGPPQQPPYQQPQPPYQQPQHPQAAPAPQLPPYGAPPSHGAPPYGTPQYPDPTVPAPYPGAMPPGGVPPQYPGYTGPSAYSQPGMPPTSGVGGLAIAALIVGIVAFLSGWVPIVGLVIAIVGIVLGILAVRQPRGKGLGITGIILSGLAALTGIVMLVITFVLIPSAANNAQVFGDDADQWAEEVPDQEQTEEGFDEAEFSTVSGQLIDTPCWSYDGPQYFTNNISEDAVAACSGKLELWGEWDDEGHFHPTGVGMTAGEISVMPVDTATSDGFGTVGDVDAAIEGLQDSFFSQQGGALIDEELVTLDGSEAKLLRYESSSPETQTKAFVVTYAPAPYPVEGARAQLFVIALVTPYSNGEEQLQQVLDTWEWK